jgi:flagellar biogenesis protein FliO
MTESNSKKQGATPSSNKQPSEFVIGLVTFIIFLIFMTIWMLWRTAD